MPLRVLQFALALLLLLGPAAEARTSNREEFKLLARIAGHIREYYFEDVSPDTLMHASLRGVFEALDLSSEYTYTARTNSWNANFEALYRITQTIEQQSLYPVSPDTLIRYGIAGMMEVLDPYTVFMEKRNLDNFIINTRGKYGGLGFRIQVVRPDSAIAVWSLLHQDTPAARAGVHSGDLIMAIDDSSTKHMTAGDAADLMRGEPGTTVTLTLSRAGQLEPFKVTIVREVVQIHSVPYSTLFSDGTGYIKLEGFQQKCSQEVRQAIAALKGQGMKRLIFDMRGNGGGYLTEAVQIANFFLPKDRLVVFTAGRALRDTTRYVTQEEPLLDKEPLLVLVDYGSASASEIVAGAIQDWDRGLVLGMPTVGKGSVQQTIPIDDKAELKLTMAAYFTPSGRSIDKRMRKDSTLVGNTDKLFKTQVLGRIVHGGGGIYPDIYLENRKSTPLFNQLSGARTLDSKFFRYARQYQVHHSRIGLDFRAEEETLHAFRSFVAGQGFNYVSDLEAGLQELDKKIAAQKEGERFDKLLKRVRLEIDDLEEKDWQANRDLLAWKLTFDILEKKLGLEAAYAYETGVDPQILQARRILNEPGAYQQRFAKPEIGEPKEQVATTPPETDDEFSEH